MHARRALLTTTLALAAGLLGACADANTPPEPEAVAVDRTASLTDCRFAQDSVDVLVPQLFVPGSERGFIASNYAKMNKELRLNRDAKALEFMWLLIDETLKDYYATPSRIVGGAASQKKVEDLVQGLLCLNDIDRTVTSANPLTLSTSGKAAVVTGGTAAIITTNDLLAATSLPSGALPAGEKFLVTVEPIAAVGPLNTPLQQYGPFYEFDIFPKTPFQVDVTTGICLNITATADEPFVRLAHDRNPASTVPQPQGNIQFGNIEILAPEAVTGLGLSCAPPQVGFFGKLLDVLLPKPLYAATLGTVGTGGKVREYSPFGGVVVPDLTYKSPDWIFKQFGATIPAADTAGIAGAAFGGLERGFTFRNADFGDVRSATGIWPGGEACNGTGGTINYGLFPATPWARSLAPSPYTDATKFTYMAGRQVFYSAQAGTATVYVAIDNDIRVIVNGTDVTASRVGPSNTLENGFVKREGCAKVDEFSFSATVNAGANYVVVITRDRGVASYFDMRVATPGPVILD